MVRNAVESIRAEERAIMRLCLRYAKMPRKDFIKSFQAMKQTWNGYHRSLTLAPIGPMD